MTNYETIYETLDRLCDKYRSERGIMTEQINQIYREFNKSSHKWPVFDAIDLVASDGDSYELARGIAVPIGDNTYVGITPGGLIRTFYCVNIDNTDRLSGELLDGTSDTVIVESIPTLLDQIAEQIILKIWDLKNQIDDIRDVSMLLDEKHQVEDTGTDF